MNRSLMTKGLDVPVCLLVYRRPELTRRVFEAVREARPRRLLVVADGPGQGDEAETRLCEMTRAIVQDVDWDCAVQTQFADSNMGLRARVSSGLSWVFSQVEEAIILEDDCLPDPSFFPYCAELLNRYRNDERVMLISGDNAHGYRPRSASYYFSRYALIWGWATWRRAWARYDDLMTSWPKSRDSGWTERLFPDPGAAAQWRAKFEDGHSRFNSWARAWIYACFQHKGLCAIPGHNLVSNIGFGQDATHTKGLIDGRSAVATTSLSFPLRHPGWIMADPAADRFIERRLFSGNVVPAHRDAADVCFGFRALKTGNPWTALNHFDKAASRLPGSATLTMIRSRILGMLGLWDQAANAWEHVPADEATDPCIAWEVARHRGAAAVGRNRAAGGKKPGRDERMRLQQALGLCSLPANQLIRLGGDPKGYGAWVVADILGPDAICYLAGAGEDLTFDCALASRYGCRVNIFDPTPRAVAHFEGICRWVKSGSHADDPVFGKYAGMTNTTLSRLSYHAEGLYERTASMRFFVPRVAEHVSHSVLNLQGTTEYFEAHCLSLSDAMQRLGHSHIDLLKLDIEGSEYGVINSIVTENLPVGMLCVEFDEGHNPLDNAFLERILACVALLRGAGFVPVCLDDWNVTFLRSPSAGFVDRALGALRALNDHQYTVALNLLERLHHERPNAAGPMFGLALTRFRLGQQGAAIAELRRLLESHPQHAKGRALLDRLDSGGQRDSLSNN